jgi:hypothetical protein
LEHVSKIPPIIFLFLLSGFLLKCKQQGSSEASQIQSGPPINQAAVGATTQAFTTLHPLSGVGQTRNAATACRLTQGEVHQIHKQGYFYAAVPDKYFQNGQACGKIIDATIAGACFKNHNSECLTPNGYHPIGDGFKGNRQIKLVVLDLCGSCVKDQLHIDVTGSAYGDIDPKSGMISNKGPLGDAYNFLAQNRGVSGGKTSEDGNYFFTDVKGLGAGETNCFDYVSHIQSSTVVWGLPKGPCAKIPESRKALFP